MNSRSRLACVLLSLVASLPSWCGPAEASGGFRWGPPRPPRITIDVKKYRRGREIFLRKGETERRARGVLERRETPELWPETPASDTFEQHLRLIELQGQLTTSEQSKIQLTTLAGKLSPAQLAALKYYLYTRGQVESAAKTDTAKTDTAKTDTAKTEKEPPADFDAEKFARGKSILEKGADETTEPTAGSPDDATKQIEALRTMEKKLPARVRRRFGLVHLGGQLDAAEMDALRYYVRTRFGIR